MISCELKQGTVISIGDRTATVQGGDGKDYSVNLTALHPGPAFRLGAAVVLEFRDGELLEIRPDAGGVDDTTAPQVVTCREDWAPGHAFRNDASGLVDTDWYARLDDGKFDGSMDLVNGRPSGLFADLSTDTAAEVKRAPSGSWPKSWDAIADAWREHKGSEGGGGLGAHEVRSVTLRAPLRGEYSADLRIFDGPMVVTACEAQRAKELLECGITPTRNVRHASLIYRAKNQNATVFASNSDPPIALILSVPVTSLVLASYTDLNTPWDCDVELLDNTMREIRTHCDTVRALYTKVFSLAAGIDCARELRELTLYERSLVDKVLPEKYKSVVQLLDLEEGGIEPLLVLAETLHALRGCEALDAQVAKNRAQLGFSSEPKDALLKMMGETRNLYLRTSEILKNASQDLNPNLYFQSLKPPGRLARMTDSHNEIVLGHAEVEAIEIAGVAVVVPPGAALSDQLTFDDATFDCVVQVLDLARRQKLPLYLLERENQ